MKNQGKTTNAVPSTNGKINGVPKMIPIIQTRGMKAKELNNTVTKNARSETVTQADIHDLSKIDNLTINEILGGEEDAGNISHDGVELYVQRSDDEGEFPDDSTARPTNFDGDSDSDVVEESPPCCFPASQVVKVSRPNVSNEREQQNDKLSKFSHLHDDPDFNTFLSEMVDQKIAGKNGRNEESRSKHHKHKSADKGIVDNHEVIDVQSVEQKTPHAKQSKQN